MAEVWREGGGERWAPFELQVSGDYSNRDVQEVTGNLDPECKMGRRVGLSGCGIGEFLA